MSYQHLTVERMGHVLTCGMANPPSHTLTAAEVQELHRLLNEVEADPNIRVLVLTGAAEGVFIAHYDVAELADTAETHHGLPEHMTRGQGELHAVHRLCLRLEHMPAITIAALNGNAAGGGCEVSLACDFRLMADGPYSYGLPETTVGIIPGAGGTQRFAHMLGTAKALDLILHGTMLTPREAFDLGLIHRLYPDAEFRQRVAEFAETLASRAPIAISAAKQAINHGAYLPLEEGLSFEQRAFNRTMQSEDAVAAMRAWLRGEDYQWRGR